MSDIGKYVLAQGAHGERRLEAIHQMWGPGMMEIALEAGLRPGMRVADFGCGVGTALASFGQVVGPEGSVVGIDISGDQLALAKARLEKAGVAHFDLLESSANSVPLESNSIDFVYSRYLLIHLTDPLGAIHEMLRVLKPGGILYIDDGDLLASFSTPPSAGDEFARIFAALGPIRQVDYRLGLRLHTLMLEAGVQHLRVRLEQPGFLSGDLKRALAWTIEETKPAVLSSGLHTEEEIDAIIAAMHRACDDETILFAVPRMTRAYGHKPS